MRYKQTLRKGFTLTEVVVSIMILSLLLVGIVGFFAQGYSNIFGLRSRNVAANKAQKEIEQRIAKIRKEGGSGTDSRNFVAVLDGKNVTIPVEGTHLKYGTDGSTLALTAFIANQKEALQELPSEIEVKIGDGTRNLYYIGETTGRATYHANKTISAAVRVETGWFLGNRNIKIEESTGVVKEYVAVPDLAISTGTSISPDFPRDYHKLEEKGEQLLITKDMAGRHLRYAVRPINKGGRVGRFYSNENTWILGMPITDKLYYHIEADSFLKVDETGERILLPRDESTQDTDFRNLYQERAYTKKNTQYALERRFESAIEQERQLVTLDGRQTIAINNAPFEATSGQLIAVRTGKGSLEGPLLSVALSNGQKSVITIQDRMITLRTEGGQNPLAQQVPVTLDIEKDNALLFQYVRQGTGVELVVYVNGTAVARQTVATQASVTQTQIVVGGKVSLSELAVFGRAFNEETIKEINQYYLDKYEINKQ